MFSDTTLGLEGDPSNSRFVDSNKSEYTNSDKNPHMLGVANRDSFHNQNKAVFGINNGYYQGFGNIKDEEEIKMFHNEKNKDDKDRIDVFLLGEKVLPDSRSQSSFDNNESYSSESEENESETEEEKKLSKENLALIDEPEVKKNLEVVCVDPISCLHYRLSMSTNNLIIEPHIEIKFPKDNDKEKDIELVKEREKKMREECEKEIKDKIQKHRNIIRNLIKLEGFIWLSNKGEADKYRRRKLPQYLLTRELSDYPCYIFQSELSKAFNSIPHINLRVNLMKYDDKIKMKKKNKAIKKFFVEIKESLVTSSKETIKNVLHEIKNKYGVLIEPAGEGSMLILKVDGFREYFKGNYQLLAYERVRLCLRGKKDKLDLILTEIPKMHVDKFFPPLFLFEEGEKFDFGHIMWSSPYFWYPPVSGLDKIVESSYIRSDKKNKYLVKIPHESFRRKRRGTLYRRTSSKVKMRSGNCNYKFKFKLIGFERLCKVFNEIILGEEATDNKATQPRNVTLMKFKKKEFNALASQAKISNIHKRLKRTKMIKSIYKKVDQYDSQSYLLGINSMFGNFSINYDKIARFKQIMFGKGSITPLYLQVECMLYHGCELLSNVVKSKKINFNNNAKFNEWISFDKMRYCELSKKTRLSFNIRMNTSEDIEMIIGSVSINLFDDQGKLNSGIRDLNIWPFYSIDSRLGCMKEYYGVSKDKSISGINFNTLFSKLYIELESFALPMYYSPRTDEDMKNIYFSSNKQDDQDKENLIDAAVTNEDLADLKKYLLKNPLQDLAPKEKDILFKCREHYQTLPSGLPLFLRSVRWNRPVQVNEVYKMIQNWAPMDPEDAICLLDAKFPDDEVRRYAVSQISRLSDDKISLYMIQFAQAILYEEQHLSPLAETLIERALKNPCVVGHSFFWALKSNLHMKPSYERYSILLEQFLLLCGKFKEELNIQCKVNNILAQVSQKIWNLKNIEKQPWDKVKEAGKIFLSRARKHLPLLFTFTGEPKVVISEFNYESFTVFSSKKIPLRITGINQQPGGDPIVTIFKNGDDLRQDILTMQMLYLMDKIWLDNELDLCMNPYKVIGTGCEQGYLEFVANSTTLAYIQYHKGIWKTFRDDTIDKFMTDKVNEKCSSVQEKEAMWKKIQYNFIRSTAGYCVASYILGLGDRHPDNIMLNMDEGNLFHIDFGHFLGNVKKKYGFKRERDPFVLTKEMVAFININIEDKLKGEESYIPISSRKEMSLQDFQNLQDEAIFDEINGNYYGEGKPNKKKTKNFQLFESLCCQAYNILRKEGHKFINMFLIMLSAGMPELSKEKDIQSIVDALVLDYTDQEASVHFRKEIARASRTWSRRFDNFIHNIKAKYS
ncbi:unnamed protein product [Moneuplotes crassus]|uniref:Phosphatidylinositol 3-kinase n=1 Tax=Euplotes crassus TaxID=5936 RepID=A0AAD1U7X9_EUPCR|nr:unnamed protein product [Moneuplotes crassus]